MRTLARLCTALDCQPGDILKFEPGAPAMPAIPQRQNPLATWRPEEPEETVARLRRLGLVEMPDWRRGGQEAGPEDEWDGTDLGI